MDGARHTKAALMIDEGDDLTVVQRTLGHAHPSITADRYVGKVPKVVRRASNRYGELTGSPLPTALLTEHEKRPSSYLVEGRSGADGRIRTDGLPLTRRLLCH